MALELRRGKDKTLRSKWWYGRYDINGKRHCVNLGIEVKGTPPASLKKTGDAEFEHSRITAQVKLDGLIFQARSQKSAEKHLEELYELKAGSAIEQVPLADIEQCWLNLPSRKRRTELWEKNQCATLRKFREFIEEHHSHVSYLAQVTPRMAQEWLRYLDELGYAAATYNDKLHLLKSFFDRMGHDAGIVRNPFAGCPTKVKATVHHQPFTLDELNRILQKADGVMRSIFIVGMCTARGREIAACLNGRMWICSAPSSPSRPPRPERRRRSRSFPLCVMRSSASSKNFGMSWRVKQVLKAANIKTDLECDDRIQNATIKGFHSLRTTWITMALSAGVPMELVRRVTGHSTVEVVLKHYFRPGREAFRNALESSLPALLTQGSAPVTEGPLQELARLAQEAPDMDKAELLERLQTIVEQIAA
jgi:integrase